MLYNSAIREQTALEWDQERPVEEQEFYLDWMMDQSYPVILVYEEGELVAFGALERWTVGSGKPLYSSKYLTVNEIRS